MPSWTQEQLNEYLREMADKALRKSPRAVTQQVVCHEPMATEEREVSHPKRLHVRVVSYRKRLCDADNLCPKYFIDCLRYCEAIKDDSAKYITLEVTQEKSQDERTEITIITPQNGNV